MEKQTRNSCFKTEGLSHEVVLNVKYSLAKPTKQGSAKNAKE